MVREKKNMAILSAVKVGVKLDQPNRKNVIGQTPSRGT